jgi:leucyl/phenylalanyl-tRNA--protein transferase
MQLTPDILLRAYAMGIFPMARARDSTSIEWVDPRQRGIFPLDRFHISRSLQRHMLRGQQRVTVDRAFGTVVEGCADRAETWINAEIAESYRALHAQGHAHSVEIWQQGDLVGGVYGVVIGAAFFGESMFSRATNASKTALAFLVHRLRAGGFQVFDTQFLTPHLASLGAIEISRSAYHHRLSVAIAAPARFYPSDYPPDPSASEVCGASQRSTQTS